MGERTTSTTPSSIWMDKDLKVLFDLIIAFTKNKLTLTNKQLRCLIEKKVPWKHVDAFILEEQKKKKEVKTVIFARRFSTIR